MLQHARWQCWRHTRYISCAKPVTCSSVREFDSSVSVSCGHTCEFNSRLVAGLSRCVLCCVMLCCAVLCCAVLWITQECMVPHDGTLLLLLHCVVSYNGSPCHVVLCRAVNSAGAHGDSCWCTFASCALGSAPAAGAACCAVPRLVTVCCAVLCPCLAVLCYVCCRSAW